MNIFSRCKTVTHKMCILKGREHDELIQTVKNHVPKHLQMHEELLKQERSIKKYVHKDVFELPMKSTLLGLFTIPVYVNDKKLKFIIDTGAQTSAIRETSAHKLKLPKTKGCLTVGSIGGGEKTVGGYICDRFVFGGIEYENLPLLKLDAKQFSMSVLGYDLIQFDGILGWDLLSSLDFELDDISKTFKVLKNIYRFEYQNMVKGEFPTFLVIDQNGRECVFGFDSGSKISWISKSYIKKAGLHVDHEIEMIGYGVHGKEVMRQDVVKNLVFYIDRAKITFFDIVTGRGDIYPDFMFDGVFGNEIFRNRRIRILNSKEMVLLV